MSAMFLLATCSLALADKEEAKYQFMLRKGEDAIEERKEKDRTLFVATSKSGIGGVQVTLAEGQWPRTVALRLQYSKDRGFTNLEAFTLQTARLHVSGSLRRSGDMELYFLGPDGKPGDLAGKAKVTVENKDGGLIVTLPAFLLTGARDARFEWIDAYRR
jgi:hypothetical protein